MVHAVPCSRVTLSHGMHLFRRSRLFETAHLMDSEVGFVLTSHEDLLTGGN